jgi:hypothetical protein
MPLGEKMRGRSAHLRSAVVVAGENVRFGDCKSGPPRPLNLSPSRSCSTMRPRNVSAPTSSLRSVLWPLHDGDEGDETLRCRVVGRARGGYHALETDAVASRTQRPHAKPSRRVDTALPLGAAVNICSAAILMCWAPRCLCVREGRRTREPSRRSISCSRPVHLSPFFSITFAGSRTPTHLPPVRTRASTTQVRPSSHESVAWCARARQMGVCAHSTRHVVRKCIRPAESVLVGAPGARGWTPRSASASAAVEPWPVPPIASGGRRRGPLVACAIASPPHTSPALALTATQRPRAALGAQGRSLRAPARLGRLDCTVLLRAVGCSRTPSRWFSVIIADFGHSRGTPPLPSLPPQRPARRAPPVPSGPLGASGTPSLLRRLHASTSPQARPPFVGEVEVSALGVWKGGRPLTTRPLTTRPRRVLFLACMKERMLGSFAEARVAAHEVCGGLDDYPSPLPHLPLPA